MQLILERIGSRGCHVARQWLSVAVFCTAALVILGACASGPEATREAASSVDTAYQLGPGDRVRIEVFGDDSMSGEQALDGEGAVSMPLIGKVDASGLSAQQLTARIEARLAEYMKEPEVTLTILTRRPFYIVGEVREPGSYAYVEGMTVINAVAMAGGYTYRAKRGAFVLERKEVSEILSAESGTPVLPGDVITVRERYF